MAKINIELAHDVFDAGYFNSERSKLGKRKITGGVKVDFSKIPSNVLEDLLHGAVIDYLQAGLKSLDLDTATREQCEAAMKARLAVLENGMVASKGNRKAPVRNAVRDQAKAIVKKSITDSSDQKLLPKVLTKTVNDLFKEYDKYTKAVKADDQETVEALAGLAALVEDAMDQARDAIAKREAMAATLAPITALAQKVSAETAAAAAEAAEAAGEMEEAPAAPRPTPTQRVKNQKGKGGAAAR